MENYSRTFDELIKETCSMYEDGDYPPFIDITNHLGKRMDVSQPGFLKKRNDRVLSHHVKNPGGSEMEFSRLLDDLAIQYIAELTFDWFILNTDPYRYDFAIIRITDDGRVLLLCIIEIDGPGHRMRPNWKEIDREKERFCEERRLRFIRINYMELALNSQLIRKYLQTGYANNCIERITDAPEYIRFELLPHEATESDGRGGV